MNCSQKTLFITTKKTKYVVFTTKYPDTRFKTQTFISIKSDSIYPKHTKGESEFDSCRLAPIILKV